MIGQTEAESTMCSVLNWMCYSTILCVLGMLSTRLKNQSGRILRLVSLKHSVNLVLFR